MTGCVCALLLGFLGPVTSACAPGQGALPVWKGPGAAAPGGGGARGLWQVRVPPVPPGQSRTEGHGWPESVPAQVLKELTDAVPLSTRPRHLALTLLSFRSAESPGDVPNWTFLHLRNGGSELARLGGCSPVPSGPHTKGPRSLSPSVALPTPRPPSWTACSPSEGWWWTAALGDGGIFPGPSVASEWTSCLHPVVSVPCARKTRFRDGADRSPGLVSGVPVHAAAPV